MEKTPTLNMDHTAFIPTTAIQRQDLSISFSFESKNNLMISLLFVISKHPSHKKENKIFSNLSRHFCFRVISLLNIDYAENSFLFYDPARCYKNVPVVNSNFCHKVPHLCQNFLPVSSLPGITYTIQYVKYVQYSITTFSGPS